MEFLLRSIYAHAKFDPEAPAIMLGDRVITYRMLVSGVLSVERHLKKLELDENCLVGVIIESPARHMIVAIALLKMGVPFTSLMPSMVSAAEAVGMKYLLSDRNVMGYISSFLHVVEDQWFSSQVETERWDCSSSRDKKIVYLAFSSGSIGISKAIGFTDNMLSNRFYMRPYDRLTGHRRYLLSFAPASMGLLLTTVSSLAQGCTVVFDQSPDEAVRLINFLGVDYIFGSNSRLQEMMDCVPKNAAPLYSVRAVFLGGSPLTKKLYGDLRLNFCARLFDSYGSTEAGTMGLASGALLDEAVGSGHSRFVPVNNIQIVDEEGRPLVGLGRIAIRSDKLGVSFTGQLLNDEGFKSEDWFYPGDAGFIDDSGILTLTGRTDFIINLGGAKFSPEVLEEELLKHQNIDDVCVLRFDEKGSQILIAYVSPNLLSIEDIRAVIADERIASSVVKVVRQGAIPRTETGKIARKMLRDSILGA